MGPEAKEAVTHPVDELSLRNRYIGARKHTKGASSHRRLKPSFTPSQAPKTIASTGRIASRIRNAALLTMSIESEKDIKLNHAADTSM